MREFMNTHVDVGKVFKAKDMQWIKTLKLNSYHALVFYGDLSYKNNACFKAMILVGKIFKEYHIIHVYLRQASRNNLAKWLYDLYETQNLERFNIKYRIEGLFAMDDFVSDFDQEGDLRGYHIPVVADKRPKIDKDERIESLAAYFERRNVFFNETEKTTADQLELKEQLMAFEKGSAIAKDGPDALEGGVAECNRTDFRERFEPRIVKKEYFNKLSKNRY